LAAAAGPGRRSSERPDSAGVRQEQCDGGKLSGQSRDRQLSDFQCPFCGRFATATWPRLNEKYVRPGRVLFAFKHLPLEQIHALARPLAEFVECARAQDQFWPLHDYIFAHQRSLSLDMVSAWASTNGLGARRSRECTDQTSSPTVTADAAEAAELGVRGTPTFFIGTLNADKTVTVTARLDGAVSLEDLEKPVGALLK